MKQAIFNAGAFAKALKVKRTIDNNLTMREVQKQHGVKPATISRMEAGNIPDVYTYSALCKWLGVSMESFFEFKTIKKS